MTDLILALDVTDREAALRIGSACTPSVDAIKIGYPLVLSAGLGIADDLAEFGVPVIADFKVADIPNTNRLIAEQVFAHGCHGIICQGFTGRDAVLACVETAHDHGGECFVVAEMSHPGAPEFFHGGVAERIAGMAVECHADGIIAPATRPDRVRELRSVVGQRKILSPGIGVQGGDPDLVSSLVDGLIVGRMIYGAEDPGAVAASLARFRR
jgi:orotidine-5'-phosphate decarboxylase